MDQYLNIGQYIPANSFLHQLDPRTKIIILACLAGSLFAVKSFAGLAVLVIMVLLLMIMSRIGMNIYLKSLKPFIIIFVAIFAAQILLADGVILWQVGFVKISWTGVGAAFNVIIRLIVLVLLARVITGTCSAMSLTCGLEKLLIPLNKIGIRTQELIMIMIISMRFIPIFSESARHISVAQQCRGVNWRKGKIKERLVNMLALLVPLLRIAMERANDLAEAMESRGFQTGASRTSLNEWNMQSKDYFTLGILALILIFTIVWPY
ncbi:MAG: energy-coupling factor transporter transmembrane protein EcfT [Syntrophomonadaceae bacterium]|jgi:energy-coupling factor transport system permease protein|nr:energy-coupling factor transporter transmembrane protein EcfT [Syntrophomonadaceae bacterium]